MRTTLSIEDDALEIARHHARRLRITLSAAVSDLVRKGAQQPLSTVDRNGLKVTRLPEGSPAVTSKRIMSLLDEMP